MNAQAVCLRCGREVPAVASPCSKCAEGHRVISVEHDNDPLSAARGVVYGVGLSVLAWAVFVGFVLVIYFNVHA